MPIGMITAYFIHSDGLILVSNDIIFQLNKKGKMREHVKNALHTLGVKRSL